MASNVSLSAVRTAVKERTHYENSNFVTTTELNALINQSVKELYDLLVTTYDGYRVSSSDSTIASGNTFNLPADFYKLLGVDYVVTSPDQLDPLARVGWSERDGSRSGYQLRDSAVVILPYAWAAGKTFRLYYVPVIATLSADGDTFDGVDGWEEYVIVDVAIKVLGKAERDASLFLSQKQQMLTRIQGAAYNRDAGEPPHVVDVRGREAGGTMVGGRWVFDMW